MAFAFTTLASTTNGWAQVIFELKQRLKLNGWTVPASSNGSTYSSSSDVITTGVTGAGGMDNTNAWFRIRQPPGGVAPFSGTREFLFQRVSSSGDIRIKYSLSAGFIGGSPGILVTPSASDGQYVAGGGNDSSPTGSTISNGTNKVMVAVETASPFAFYANQYASASVTLCGLGFDPVTQAPFDATNAPESDGDPYVAYWFSNGYSMGEESFGLSESAWCNWYSPDESFWGLVGVGKWIPQDGTYDAFPGVRTTNNPYNSKIDTMPVPWVGAFGPATTYVWAGKTGSGVKGYSKHLKFSERSSAGVFNGDTVSDASTKDLIFIGNALFPWNGT
jgi:hypothetical protein